MYPPMSIWASVCTMFVGAVVAARGDLEGVCVCMYVCMYPPMSIWASVCTMFVGAVVAARGDLEGVCVCVCVCMCVRL